MTMISFMIIPGDTYPVDHEYDNLHYFIHHKEQNNRKQNKKKKKREIVRNYLKRRRTGLIDNVKRPTIRQTANVPRDAHRSVVGRTGRVFVTPDARGKFPCMSAGERGGETDKERER